MQNQFVTYEIALKLKELGFREDCLYYFDSFKYTGSSSAFWDNYNKSELLISKPLYQQVIDWLREEHGIHVIINKTYGYVLLLNKRNPIGKNNIGNYYKAREQAILKALELIIE